MSEQSKQGGRDFLGNSASWISSLVPQREGKVLLKDLVPQEGFIWPSDVSICHKEETDQLVLEELGGNGETTDKWLVTVNISKVFISGIFLVRNTKDNCAEDSKAQDYFFKKLSEEEVLVANLPQEVSSHFILRFIDARKAWHNKHGGGSSIQYSGKNWQRLSDNMAGEILERFTKLADDGNAAAQTGRPHEMHNDSNPQNLEDLKALATRMLHEALDIFMHMTNGTPLDFTQ